MSVCTGSIKYSDETYKDTEEAYEGTMVKCYAFGSQLMANTYLADGKEYAGLCDLPYRRLSRIFRSLEASDELLCFAT